jgi:uncharacterized membrane protein YhaH (DUF805 family)
MTMQGGAVGGWFPDPWQPSGQIRWWSGTEWTSTVHAMPQVAREVEFGEAVKRGFRGWNKWSGRASLTEYWWWFLFGTIVTYAVYFIAYFFVVAAFVTAIGSGSHEVLNSDGTYTMQSDINGGAVGVGLILGLLLAIAFTVFFVVPWLAVAARRLHDSGRSAAWLWLLLVPVGQLFVLVFLAMPSAPGPNQYGPVPS